MNSFQNPLVNPNLDVFETPDSEAKTEVENHLEGQMGQIWTRGDLIDSLNRLIQVCRDGQEGYLQAAEHVKSAWLHALFQNFSMQREQFATELANLVASYGVEPVTGTTVAGVLHRTWVDLRSAVAGDMNEDIVILEECESGEDTTKEAYETELNKGLPEHVHRVVQSQYQDIARAHDQIREARDAFAQ